MASANAEQGCLAEPHGLSYARTMPRGSAGRAVLLAVSAGVVGAIGPYLLLISPMEHLREWARAELEVGGPITTLARFAAWSVGGGALGLLLCVLPSASRSESASREGDR